MQRFIIQEDIRRFRRLMTSADDGPDRARLCELLTAEARKLAEIKTPLLGDGEDR